MRFPGGFAGNWMRVREIPGEFPGESDSRPKQPNFSVFPILMGETSKATQPEYLKVHEKGDGETRSRQQLRGRKPGNDQQHEQKKTRVIRSRKTTSETEEAGQEQGDIATTGCEARQIPPPHTHTRTRKTFEVGAPTGGSLIIAELQKTDATTNPNQHFYQSRIYPASC